MIIYSYLVGGLEHGFYDFPYILGIIIIPTDELHHFSERLKPATRKPIPINHILPQIYAKYSQIFPNYESYSLKHVSFIMWIRWLSISMGDVTTDVARSEWWAKIRIEPEMVNCQWETPHLCYPLVMTNIAMERSTIFDGKIHYKWPFSIAMLVYQRVMIFQEGALYNTQKLECKIWSPSNRGTKHEWWKTHGLMVDLLVGWFIYQQKWWRKQLFGLVSNTNWD